MIAAAGSMVASCCAVCLLIGRHWLGMSVRSYIYKDMYISKENKTQLIC